MQRTPSTGQQQAEAAPERRRTSETSRSGQPLVRARGGRQPAARRQPAVLMSRPGPRAPTAEALAAIGGPSQAEPIAAGNTSSPPAATTCRPPGPASRRGPPPPPFPRRSHGMGSGPAVGGEVTTHTAGNAGDDGDVGLVARHALMPASATRRAVHHETRPGSPPEARRPGARPVWRDSAGSSCSRRDGRQGEGCAGFPANPAAPTGGGLLGAHRRVNASAGSQERSVQAPQEAPRRAAEVAPGRRTYHLRAWRETRFYQPGRSGVRSPGGVAKGRQQGCCAREPESPPGDGRGGHVNGSGECGQFREHSTKVRWGKRSTAGSGSAPVLPPLASLPPPSELRTEVAADKRLDLAVAVDAPAARARYCHASPSWLGCRQVGLGGEVLATQGRWFPASRWTIPGPESGPPPGVVDSAFIRCRSVAATRRWTTRPASLS